MATYNPAQVVASRVKTGPVVQSMSAQTIAILAGNYTFDYPNFLRLIDSYVNHLLYTIEEAQPEGTPMELVLPGLQGYAIQWATALQQQFQQGKIQVNGTQIKPWANFPNQIAWSDSTGDTMYVRWVKEEWEAWLIVGVLAVVIIAENLNVLRGSNYSLSAYTPTTGGTPTTTTPGQAAGGILTWAVQNWPVIVVGAGVLVAAPFVVRHVAGTEESVNELRAAERGYRGGGR